MDLLIQEIKKAVFLKVTSELASKARGTATNAHLVPYPAVSPLTPTVFSSKNAWLRAWAKGYCRLKRPHVQEAHRGIRGGSTGEFSHLFGRCTLALFGRCQYSFPHNAQEWRNSKHGPMMNQMDHLMGVQQQRWGHQLNKHQVCSLCILLNACC